MSRTVIMTLTNEADKEVTRIVNSTSLKTDADVFRAGLTLLRIHLKAAHEGKEVRLGDSDKIVLPLDVY